MDFKKINNWTGWLVTLIACTVYIMTSEAASSFWDCGEFISSAYKLQIPHPPGAPMFVLLGRIFIILFGDNPLTAAKAVNTMSALASGFTILFLFWTITHFAKRIVVKQTGTEPVGYQILAIMGAGIVGALAYTFSDSFWYSAVEGEVYALSSFFTALVFWAILKWEHKADQPGADKWIIFIFYMMGLSIGVHLLNILTIPAIVMVYYFRNYKPTWKGGLFAFLVGVVITGFIQVVLIQYTVKWAGAFDVNFVNSMGLPFFSGFIFFFVLLAAILAYAIHYANKKGIYFLKLGVWSMIFMLLGYTTYITTMIRSNADPSVDMYNVDNPVTLVGYLGREQYGDWPILFGPDYVDKVDNVESGDQYVKAPTNYELAGKSYKRDWSSAPSSHLFPRMWDGENDRGQMDSYKAFAGVVDGEAPTLRDNIKYFTNYQFGFMYLRYFLWNFAGKQNDLQGFGNVRDGNFSTGISFIDNFFFGDQSKLPDTIKNNNKAHNSLFMLPFFLGLFGFLFQYQQNKKDFIVTGLLFFFTGLAIVLYLNQVSLQPRERDYAYVGSFYVFAMWIGVGVFAIYEGIKNYIKPNIAIPVTLAITLLSTPVLMAKENWDDHDRSGKHTALAMAKAYLDSCEPNAILFTIGDNDTFPLWYAQEIEGYRTDIRIVNTSLFMTDWYIDQMKRKAYDSEPIPSSFDRKLYRGSNRDYSFLIEKTKDSILLSDLIKFISLEDERAQVELNSGQFVNYYPSNQIIIPINKEEIIKNKVVSPKFYDSIVPAMQFKIKGQALYKNRLMMLDIVNENNWKRPIYFTGGSFGEDDYIWMKDYLQLDGMCYKLVPIKTSNGKESPNPLEMGYLDSDKMFDIVMKWDWGNSGNPEMYHDPETRKNGITYRTNLARLMETLINEGKNDKAEKIIELAMAKMPVDLFEYYTLVEPFAQGYYEIGKKEKARAILKQLIVKYQEELTYFSGFKPSEQREMTVDIVTDIERYRGLLEIMQISNDLEFFNQEKVKFNNFNKMFELFGRKAE